eukprot:SAG31_NODE_6671_length_1924_cov_2.909389_2_plen_75_part_00
MYLFNTYFRNHDMESGDGVQTIEKYILWYWYDGADAWAAYGNISVTAPVPQLPLESTWGQHGWGRPLPPVYGLA